MKIFFVFPYPLGCAASQRFRFEQYLPILDEKGIEYCTSPFLDEGSWSIFYRKGFILKKFFGLMKGFLKRFVSLTFVWSYDYIFIHRESAPIGPPIFEWLVTKIFRKALIYDFDDAIWIANSSDSNRFFSPLKRHKNFFNIASWASKISAGNRHLVDVASNYNEHVILNPTTIDLVNVHKGSKEYRPGRKLIVGWTGSHSTIKYLEPLQSVMEELRRDEDISFEFVVISDEKPLFDGDFRYVEWNKESEIDDLIQLDIGLMPLTKDPWSEGKCGFKALQYMALGIPALVSPVGVNEEIVEHEVSGYICRDQSDWKKYISKLIQDDDLREKLGRAGKERIERDYSVRSNASNFLNLFA